MFRGSTAPTTATNGLLLRPFRARTAHVASAVGAGCDEDEARAPVVLDTDAARVRVVAVSDHPASYAATP